LTGHQRRKAIARREAGEVTLTLFRLGMTLDEIKETLLLEAEHGRHPIQRNAQIKSIMVSLKRKKRSTQSA
jgi:hypothetical protein